MDTSYTSTGANDKLVIKRADSSGSVVDSMVDATKRSTSWVVENCGMCTQYVDRQVQYEIMAQRFQGAAHAATSSLRPSGTFDIEAAVAACHQNFDDIKATAAMMFDEDSVVESVELR